jgi:hypothetical protein
LELRVGAAPTLAGLPPAAHVANAGGVVRLRLPTPAHGRYVLIWFTSLPPGPAGTYQASVYNLQLEGRAGRPRLKAQPNRALVCENGHGCGRAWSR